MNSKIILIVLLFQFSVQLIYSQKVENGSYKSVYYYNPITKEIKYNAELSERIEINNDSAFTYYYDDDIDHYLGEGIYLEKDKQLILNFKETTVQNKTTSFKILKTENILDDTISLNFLVRDRNDDTPLKGAFISLKNNQFNKDSLYSIIDLATNKTGFVSTKLTKEQFPLIVIITYVGFDPIKFTIENVLTATIQIDMDYHHIRPIKKGATIKYDIKEVSDEGFYLQGGIWNEWTYFLKTK